MEQTSAEPKNTTSQDNAKKKPTRDEKGHFVSSKGNSDKKKAKDNAVKPDKDTVKIKVIREKKPLPPKDFVGKLEDVKERTATNFIKAVCIRKPKSISIDGNIYYTQEELKTLAKKLEETESREDDALKTQEKMSERIKSATATIDFLGDALKSMRYSRFIWRSVAIIAISAFLSFAVGQVVGKCVARQSAGKTPTAQVNQVE